MSAKSNEKIFMTFYYIHSKHSLKFAPFRIGIECDHTAKYRIAQSL